MLRGERHLRHRHEVQQPHDGVSVLIEVDRRLLACPDAVPKLRDMRFNFGNYFLAAGNLHAAWLVPYQRDQPAILSVRAGHLMQNLQDVVVGSAGDRVTFVFPAVAMRRPLDLDRVTTVRLEIQRCTHAGTVIRGVVIDDLLDLHVPAVRRPVSDAAFEECAGLNGLVVREILRR